MSTHANRGTPACRRFPGEGVHASMHLSARKAGKAGTVTAFHPTGEQSRKAIYAATIGNVMEWYDFGVFGYLAGSLALNFFPRTTLPAPC